MTFCRAGGCAWRVCLHFRAAKVLPSGRCVLVTKGVVGEGLERCWGVRVRECSPALVALLKSLWELTENVSAFVFGLCGLGEGREGFEPLARRCCGLGRMATFEPFVAAFGALSCPQRLAGRGF